MYKKNNFFYINSNKNGQLPPLSRYYIYIYKHML